MTGPENQRYSVCSTCRRTTPRVNNTASIAGRVCLHGRSTLQKLLKSKSAGPGVKNSGSSGGALASPRFPLIIVGAITLTALYKYTDAFDPLVTSVTSNSAAGQWSMIGGDLARTGAVGANTALPQGKALWTFDTGKPIQSSPAVVGGTVYIGSEDNHLYALDAVTGAQKWAFAAGSFRGFVPHCR